MTVNDEPRCGADPCCGQRNTPQGCISAPKITGKVPDPRGGVATPVAWLPRSEGDPEPWIDAADTEYGGRYTENEVQRDQGKQATMHDTNPRPMLANAREAADAYLLRQTLDNGMAPDVAKGLATTGFTTATRILSELRKQGVSEQCITESFQRKLDTARKAGDVQRTIAAEFTLAIWDGMQRDLAGYLRHTG